MTEEEWNAIIERFPFGHSCHLPLQLAYRCGLRLGEAFALDWTKDIDLNAGSLDVNKQVQEINGHWTFVNPKYGSFRTIALDKPMIEVLKKAITQIERAEKYYAEYSTRLYENPQRQIVAENGPGCKEIHMLTVRPNGTYIQPRTMQHCARLCIMILDTKILIFTHCVTLIRQCFSKKVPMRRMCRSALDTKTSGSLYRLMRTIQRKCRGKRFRFLMSSLCQETGIKKDEAEKTVQKNSGKRP